MEKKSIFENKVKDDNYCEVENCDNEMLETRFEEDRYYYNDNEYTLEDTWDAMTDGMYGDMPEGWDGDLEFLGY